MPVERHLFGFLSDGRRVDRFVLSHPDSGFELEIIEYGAAIRAVRVPDRHGRRVNVVLAYPNLADYERDTAYLGATIGRCAGRTAASAHQQLHLACNEGSNSLHGGRTGFSRSLWRAAWFDEEVARIRLEHCSPHGEDGYPGDVCVNIEFSIVSPLAFRIAMEATTDRTTPLSLTTHPYFNLAGDADTLIDDHELRIASATILPTGTDRLPIGEQLRVDGTPFDFRNATAIGARLHADHPQLRIAMGYDHYFILDDGAAAEAFSSGSGICMSLSTDQPGLQFYSGNALDASTSERFRARTGFCLEPHGFPNAINESRFPDVTLRPGEVYRNTSTYAFSSRP